MEDELPVADRLKGRELRIEPLVEALSHFRHPPLLDHSAYTTCDAIVQDASRKGQTDAQSRERFTSERPFGDPLRLRPAGNDGDLQSAQDPLGVARHQPGMALAVAPQKLRAKRRQPLLDQPDAQLGPDRFVTRWDRADAVEKGA